MNRYFITLPCTTLHPLHESETTARERAIYTTSWFMNGKRPETNKNHHPITIQGALPC